MHLAPSRNGVIKAKVAERDSPENMAQLVPPVGAPIAQPAEAEMAADHTTNGRAKDAPLLRGRKKRYWVKKPGYIQYPTTHSKSAGSNDVPFVFLVFKRTEYMQRVIESLLASDFPRDRVPIVISHDGKVPEMVEYVESIKKDFRVIQIFHPHSCYEHQDSFPGNDTSLNLGYPGDTYGNPRSPWATCCKHHFSWMLNTVFHLEELRRFNTFLFSEEDYILLPSVYENTQRGLDFMSKTENQTVNGYFGMTFDQSNGGKPWTSPQTGTFHWIAGIFKTGPVALNRNVFWLIQENSVKYCCGFDEYNWDWTLYHMMVDGLLPFTVLQPEIPLVQHIGVVGMHTTDHATRKDVKKRGLAVSRQEGESYSKFLASYWNSTEADPRRADEGGKDASFPRLAYSVRPPALLPDGKPNGGWNHPVDHQHCMFLFGHNISLPPMPALQNQSNMGTPSKPPNGTKGGA